MYQLSLIDQLSKRTIWSRGIADPERLAGMMAIGEGIIESLGTNVYLDTPFDISRFRLLSHIPTDKMLHHTSSKLPVGLYGIWLKASGAGRYNLFTFGTIEFVIGMDDMCQITKVDIRNYMYGFIFDYTGKLYTMKDNGLTFVQFVADVPDLDDMEEEEEGNIIELYHPDMLDGEQIAINQ